MNPWFGLGQLNFVRCQLSAGAHLRCFCLPLVLYPLEVPWIGTMQTGVQSTTDSPRDARGEEKSVSSNSSVVTTVQAAVVLALRIVPQFSQQVREHDRPQCTDSPLEGCLPSNDKSSLILICKCTKDWIVACSWGPSRNQAES